MRGFTVARVWGIPIRVGSSLLVFLPVLVYLIGGGGQIPVYAGLIGSLTGIPFDTAALRTGVRPWLIGTLAAVGLFVSVTLHELGHSWVALRYDIGIESITLWILGGLAALERVPREWDRELWIALAGPAVSVLVGVVCWGLTLLTPASLPIVRFTFGWLALTNVSLTVFNLLPAFPMDGGRVLRALLARRRPYAVATRLAARIGVLFAVLFAVVGVIGFNVILVLLALFVYGAATTESRTVVLDELLDGLTVRDVMGRDVDTVDADTPLSALGDRMLDDRRTTYAVTEDGAVVGIVSLSDLKGRRRRDEGPATVRAVMREAHRLHPDADAFEAITGLGAAGASGAVVEEDGRLVGLVTESDLGHALRIRRGFDAGLPG